MKLTSLPIVEREVVPKHSVFILPLLSALERVYKKVMGYLVTVIDLLHAIRDPVFLHRCVLLVEAAMGEKIQKISCVM